MNGIPPSPGLWQEARAPDGRTYYYNTVTKETQWVKPADLMTPLERAIAQQPWREFATPEGRKYWNHKETKQSVWEIPEAYKNATASVELPPKSVAQAPTFVAGGSSTLPSYALTRDDYSSDQRRIEQAPAVSDLPVAAGEPTLNYSSFEEAEAAFLKLLKRFSVQPDWTWEQTMRTTIKDPSYRALKDPKDRKAAFEKFVVEVRQQEKERAKDRLAKLKADFGTMLRRHPEIKHYSRWKSIRPIIEGEAIFRSTDDEDERRQLFEEYRLELRKAYAQSETVNRRSALDDLGAILKALDLEPYTRWSEAQKVIQANERIQNDAKFQTLTKSDILTAFESHIKSLERAFNDDRQRQKNSKAREERRHRDQFIALLTKLRSKGQIKADTKWMTVLPQFEKDPRYVAMLGQAGSTPLDLFWEAVEEEDKTVRVRRNDVYDVLQDKRYEITANTTFAEFAELMVTDARTADIEKDALRLIFDRTVDKVVKRNEDVKKDSDRHERRATDALRSRIKHLDPPVRIGDTWESVKPRIEKFEEYRALDSDDRRRAAFDKYQKRLREKEEDADRDRDRRRPRKGDDRELRNGHAGRRSRQRTPEVDAYEADRRKAMADREKSYRKSNALGLSPTSSHHHRDRERDRDQERERDQERDRERERERDRDRERDRERDRRDWNDRHGRLERSPSRQHPHYDRERRDREDERERLWRTRGDPRGSRDELNYGDEARSVTGSEKRRRRGEQSEGESEGSARRSNKRYRREVREPRERRKSKSPDPAKKEVPAELVGVHSGSEEGEIEED